MAQNDRNRNQDDSGTGRRSPGQGGQQPERQTRSGSDDRSSRESNRQGQGQREGQVNRRQDEDDFEDEDSSR